MLSAFAANFYRYLQPIRIIAKFAFIKVLTQSTVRA